MLVNVHQGIQTKKAWESTAEKLSITYINEEGKNCTTHRRCVKVAVNHCPFSKKKKEKKENTPLAF